MIYKPYGKTGMTVSAIGMGGMRFLREEYQDGAFGRCAELVHAASDLGINYFDTAPGYCDDKSEYIFGEAFRTMKRDSFVVSTKCGLWTVDDKLSARDVIYRSLERLHVDYIDIYNMWCIKTMAEFEEFTKPGGIYEAALRAKEEGLIRHVCFTTHMAGKDIRTVAKTGLFEGVTLGYNAINFAYRQDGVDGAYDAGLGVVTMNPLGGGMIPENPQHFGFLRQGADSLTVAALKFITSQPQVTVALCGVSTMEQLKEDVKAAEDLYEISDAFYADMAKNLTGGMNTMCTSCGYCDSCPAGVPIPKLMEAYNRFILSGDMARVHDRLSGHWGIDKTAAQACVACGQCEKLCTQKLPIIERMREIASQ